MRTFSSIVALVIVGFIVKMIIPPVWAVLNFPGRWVAFLNASGKSSRSRLILGTTTTVVLQSYAYLAYTALVVHWAMLAMQKEGVSFIVWFAAIFAVFLPVGAVQKDPRMNTGAEGGGCSYRTRLNEVAQNKATEREEKLQMDARATSITFLLTLIGFVVFAFFQKSAEIFYGWIPFHAFHYPVQ